MDYATSEHLARVRKALLLYNVMKALREGVVLSIKLLGGVGEQCSSS